MNTPSFQKVQVSLVSALQLLHKELATLKEQKRGLMQKLLAGEVRVKAQKV